MSECWLQFLFIHSVWSRSFCVQYLPTAGSVYIWYVSGTVSDLVMFHMFNVQGEGLCFNEVLVTVWHTWRCICSSAVIRLLHLFLFCSSSLVSPCGLGTFWCMTLWKMKYQHNFMFVSWTKMCLGKEKIWLNVSCDGFSFQSSQQRQHEENITRSTQSKSIHNFKSSVFMESIMWASWCVHSSQSSLPALCLCSNKYAIHLSLSSFIQGWLLCWGSIFCLRISYTHIPTCEPPSKTTVSFSASRLSHRSIYWLCSLFAAFYLLQTLYFLNYYLNQTVRRLHLMICYQLTSILKVQTKPSVHQCCPSHYLIHIFQLWFLLFDALRQHSQIWGLCYNGPEMLILHATRKTVDYVHMSKL